MTESQQLLAQYAQTGSETAFRKVVARYINLNLCINHLRQIDGAMQQYALENKLTPTNTVTFEKIAPYLKNTNEVFRCPLGGTYALGRVADLPSCTVPGHALPMN